MKKSVSTTVMICVFAAACCQTTAKRDSLLQLLAKAKEDTGKVKLLYRLAFYYEMSNQDSSGYYLKKTKLLADSLHYTRGKYLYYERSVVRSYTQGDYAAAMEQSNLGLALARELKDSTLVSIMLNNIAITYSFLEKYPEQLDYTLQVQKIVESTGDSAKMSAMYHNTASCYFNLGQYRKSADCALFSIKLYTVYKTRNDYINRVYGTLAKTYASLNKTDSALYYFDKAVAASLQQNDKYALVNIYMEQCNVYAGQKLFRQMLPVAEKSLALAKEIQSEQAMASSLYNMAAAYFYNGYNKEAENAVSQAISTAKKNGLLNDLQNSYSLLSYIAARNGNYAQSVEAAAKMDSMREASLNNQIVSNTAEMEKKYETEKKDKQIILQQAQLEKRKYFILLLTGSALLLLLTFLFSYRIYRQKQRLQQQRITELETEKQLTATEAVLLGEAQERTRLARDLHDGLGGMLSGIKYSMNTMKGNLIMTPENQQAFERSMDMLDSSIREMRRVAHNMMPEALVKFGLNSALADFCNDINKTGALHINYQSMGMEDAVIDQTTAITLYRVVQELINNTLKHAGATSAIVQLTQSGSQLSLTVEDNGKGFDTAVLQKQGGIGWSNIRNRIDFLKGRLDIQSDPAKGTSVHIEFQT